jgi:phosphatidylglycerophosphate synthase
MRVDEVSGPAALVIPADPAFFETSVCGTSLMLRAVCALGRVAETVHVLRTPACGDSAVREVESGIGAREIRTRIEWTNAADSIPTDRGLFVVARPGVFDHRLCAELSAQARGEGDIIRCRRPGQDQSPLWFAGKGSAGRLVRHLAKDPGEKILSEPDLATAVRDFHPDGAVCEIISDDRSRRLVEKKLLKRSGKAADSPVAKWFDRNISGWLTRYLIRLPVTPNQVTVLNALFGLIGAALLLAGGYWASVSGSVILVLSIIFDGCDGEIARLKFLESEFGRKLDFFLDNVVNTAAIFAAGAGYYRQSGESLYLYLGLYTAALAAAAVWPVYSLFFQEKQKPADAVREGKADAFSVGEELQGRDFAYLILFLALIGRAHWFSLIASVGLTAFLVFMMFLLVKRQRAGVRATAA